jgi:transposase
MLRNMLYLSRPVKCKRKESGRKINKKSQKNTKFTWFTAKSYIHRVATNFTMIEKNNTIDFYNFETLIKLFNSQIHL